MGQVYSFEMRKALKNSQDNANISDGDIDHQTHRVSSPDGFNAYMNRLFSAMQSIKPAAKRNDRVHRSFRKVAILVDPQKYLARENEQCKQAVSRRIQKQMY